MHAPYAPRPCPVTPGRSIAPAGNATGLPHRHVVRRPSRTSLLAGGCTFLAGIAVIFLRYPVALSLTALTAALVGGWFWGRHAVVRPARSQESDLRGLMAMATHDMKSPLAAAVANLDLLREDHGGRIGDEGEQCLRATERALGRVNGLVEDLLSYATADQRPLDPRPVALGDEVADRIADVDGEVSVRGPLPVVLADRGLLGHVLDNLIGNAVKYTPAGSRARVEISARPGADGLIRVEVADRGIGIPAADRPKVFEAFHRSANSGAYRGTGLGLAICRRIVERHGGRIGVEENPGGGSRFWFTLPAPRSSWRSAGSR